MEAANKLILFSDPTTKALTQAPSPLELSDHIFQALKKVFFQWSGLYIFYPHEKAKTTILDIIVLYFCITLQFYQMLISTTCTLRKIAIKSYYNMPEHSP